MLSEIDDLKSAAQVAAKVDFAGAPGSVAAEAVTELEAVRNMVDAAEANALSAFDASKEWVADGHRSAGAWLKWVRRLPKAVAHRRVKHAKALRAMPVTADAFACGDISAEHVDRLVRARRPEVAEEFAESEEHLVNAAKQLSFWEFCQVVAYWEAVVDPDDLDRNARRTDQARNVHLSALMDGEGRLDGFLTPICRVVFGDELARLEQHLFDEDWAEARDRLGDQATKDDLRRTSGQRRHDALEQMAIRSREFQGEPKGPTWVANLHMTEPAFKAGLERLLGEDDPTGQPEPDDSLGFLSELDDGTILPPERAVWLALWGQARRVVFGSQGEILDFGRRKRLFDGALREAILIRDRTCFHKSCDQRGAKLQIDHHPPYSRGGTTSIAGGRPACGYHNRWDYRTRWQC